MDVGEAHESASEGGSSCGQNLYSFMLTCRLPHAFKYSCQDRQGAAVLGRWKG